MRNISASLYYFLARVLAAAVQLKIVSHYFGGQYAGLNAVLNQLAFYVALIELGLAAAAISLLYEPIAARNHEHVAGLLYALHRDTRRLMIAALPVIGILVYAYARTLKSTLPSGIVLAALSLTALSGLITLFSIHFQAYLNASEQMFKIHTVLGSGHIAKTLVGVGLAVATRNYVWVPGVMAAVSLGEVMTLRWSFHRSFPAYVPNASSEFFSLIRSRAKYVLFHRIGGLIYYQSDFIILSLATNLVLVKDYAQVQYIAMGILGLFTAVFNALTASIARSQLGVDAAVRWRQYRSVAQATYFIALTVTIAFFFAAPFAIRVVFSSSAPGTVTLALFGALLLLNLIRTVDDTYVTASGAFHVAFYLPLIEGPVYIAFGVVLAHRYGMDGVLWAGILTNVLFVVIAKSMVVARGVFDASMTRMFALRVWNSFAALVLGLPFLGWCLFVDRHFPAPAMRFGLVSLAAVVWAGGIGFYVVHRGFRRATSAANALSENKTGIRAA